MTRWLIALAACSGGTTKTDAPPGVDSSFAPPVCSVTPGYSFTLSKIGFMMPGSGFDLDGDGTIDNALGFLAPVANQVIGDNVDSGFSRYLFNIEGWDNRPADDNTVTMVQFFGVDADQPPDTSNDFTGAGEFYVTGRDFDVNCNPINTSRVGNVTNRVLRLQSDRWGLFVRNIGTVVLSKLQLVLTMSPDLRTADGQMGAVFTECGMSRAYLPQLGSGTFLDLMLVDNRQPDIDVDGDGLETITYVDSKVTGCVDGDGTPIAGAQCVCDPRIRDGYSVGVFATGVSAKIVGVLETD